MQNGDRFYYLSRSNFLNQLEGTSFSELVMRNTDTTHLPFDVFAVPTYTIEAGDPSTYPVDAAGNPLVTTNHGGRLGFLSDDHVVIGGTNGRTGFTPAPGTIRSGATVATMSSTAPSATMP